MDSRFFKAKIGMGKFQGTLLPPIPKHQTLNSNLIRKLLTSDSPEEVWDKGETNLQLSQNEKSLEDIEKLFMSERAPEDYFDQSLEILLHWNRFPVNERFKLPLGEQLLNQIQSNEVETLKKRII